MLVLAVIVISWPFGCGCVDGILATGKGAIEAMEAQDAERFASYFIEDLREEVILAMEAIFAVVDDIKLSNIEWEIIAETADEATVDIGLDWEVTALGETHAGHAREPIDLEKVNGAWLINDFTPFEWFIREILSLGSE
ncbi:MAG: nuclear transport factor 2 family protein [Dehalococcoidia bacterium]|nr:MAG: nuclear transport factor 2 family protein [Dehalococcoidia bacterium]UCG83638.1 MAG: nuclear transport factor 2 family protein [Dehalococcoidia bacterium]